MIIFFQVIVAITFLFDIFPKNWAIHDFFNTSINQYPVQIKAP